jgi:PAS domain S-box-containing protein
MTESSPTEQTNALLAAVVAASMDAVFSIDTNARIQTWNSAAEQLYGYTAAEAIGQLAHEEPPIGEARHRLTISNQSHASSNTSLRSQHGN